MIIIKYTVSSGTLLQQATCMCNTNTTYSIIYSPNLKSDNNKSSWLCMYVCMLNYNNKHSYCYAYTVLL